MTEEEWLLTDDLDAMLAQVFGNWSKRRRRLCAIAFHRAVETDYDSSCISRIAMVAEERADGESLVLNDDHVFAVMLQYAARERSYVARLLEDLSLESLQEIELEARRYRDRYPQLFRRKPGQANQVEAVKDLAGNPFRKVEFDLCWRTADVLGLAHSIYATSEFKLMPFLADALMDAGCDRDDLLNHCREESPHVRGCWLVDLILEKS
jgi:hypothetical protein